MKRVITVKATRCPMKKGRYCDCTFSPSFGLSPENGFKTPRCAWLSAKSNWCLEGTGTFIIEDDEY